MNHRGNKSQQLLFAADEPALPGTLHAAKSSTDEAGKRRGRRRLVPAHPPAPAHLIIRASAGTGKTFQLSNRFLKLLVQGEPADQILASTFTRKAAGEILDRVLVRLAKAALEPPTCAELAAMLETPQLDSETCLGLLQDVVRSLHRLRICTLDSFFIQLAGSFSLELDLPPGWQIVDELQDARLRTAAIGQVLQKNDAGELRNLMHLLTKGEARRSVSELIRSTVNDLYDLYQETDADAWHRLARPKPLEQGPLEAALQQLADVPLDGKNMLKARDGDLRKALAGDWQAFLSNGLACKIAGGSEKYGRQTIPPHLLPVYEPLIEHARAELIGLVAMQTEATYALLAKFDAEYQRLKRQRRAMRFDDVTRRLAAATGSSGLFRSGTDDRLAVGYRLDGGIDHLLLDEFQDTSPAQWQVVRPFAREVTRGVPGRSFFCVGDMKQAIYGWRGGVAEIFDAVASELPGLDTSQLNQSFRSSPAVIEAVNQIFSRATQHGDLGRYEDAVRTWCKKFATHCTARSELPGYVTLESTPEAEEQGKTAQHNVALAYAADRVAELAARAPDCSIGVLVRKNQAVGRLIYELHHRGVAASEEGGNPLTDSAAVRVILSLLQLADHSGNTVARFHLSHSPLADALDLSDVNDACSARRVAIEVRRRLQADGYGPTMLEWARQLAPCCSRRERSRLDQLVELAYAYQVNATLRTMDFVEHVESQKVADPSSANVRVMTVHQSKGLQFDVVVLPELDVQLMGQSDSFVVERKEPTSPATRVCRYTSQEVQRLMPRDVQKMFDQATQRNVAESLCVLYVAVTRAVHALYMFVPPQKKISKTYAGLLRAALTDGGPAEPETVLYRHGEADWLERRAASKRRETAAKTAAGKADRLRKRPVVRLAAARDGRRRGLERAAPSGLEGGSRVRLSDVIRRGQEAALRRGTLIHGWFELIEWLDAAAPAREQLELAANRLLETAISTKELTRLSEQFYQMLRKPAVAAALSRTSYDSLAQIGFDRTLAKRLEGKRLRLEVHNERPFAVRDDGRLLSGTIDRLVLLHDDDRLVAADIVDYKTDTLNADDADAVRDKIQFYQPQIAAYRRAVANMTGLAPQHIAARLIFVSPGLVQTLNNDLV